MTDTRAFHDAAKFQRVCAMCDKPLPFHAHHVIYEQDARNALGVRKHHQSLYDPRNSLRLCDRYGNDCHMRHHNANCPEEVKTIKLKDENVAYAFEILGLYGADYLRRKYDDTEQDPRIVEHEARLEAA